MQGEHVSLWPYVRGWASRDLPFTLWTMIETAGDWDKIMWGATPYTDTPTARFGDLTDWVHFMHGDNNKAWLMVVDNETANICGLIWFSHVQDKSACGSIWLDPQVRGKPHAREAVKLGLDYGHQQMGWDTIQALTPWPIARNLIKKCGFKDVALIPTLLGPHPVWLLEHKQES